MTMRTKKTTEADLPLETQKEWRMAIPTADTKENTSNTHTKKMMNFIFAVMAVFLLYKLGTILYNKKVQYDVTKKNIACPTLLSISRSARDTLLVMKSEPLCTEYVLDNIR